MTLLQLEHKLVEWFSNHAQINQVTTLKKFKLNAERNLIYPLVNLEWSNSVPAPRTLGHVFQVTIADLVDSNHPDISKNVVDQSIQIAEDFFSWIRNEEGIVTAQQNTISPFSQKMGDVVEGITYNVRLDVMRELNNCQTPVKS